MADIKNFGIKGVGDSVQFGKAGGLLSYSTGDTEFTISADLVGQLVPTKNAHLASKSYVDSVAQGLDVKESCRAASTVDIPDLTAPGAIDGVTLATGERVLLKDQATASQNGLYELNGSGELVRTADGADGAMTSGAFTYISEGTANAGKSFVLSTPDPIVVGTTNLTFTQFAGAGTITAGAGIDITGGVVSVDIPNLPLHAQANIIDTDEMMIYDVTGVALKKTTIADLKAEIAGGLSSNSLTRDDSSLVLTDADDVNDSTTELLLTFNSTGTPVVHKFDLDGLQVAGDATVSNLGHSLDASDFVVPHVDTTGKLAKDDNFYYDPTENGGTLHVPNITGGVTGTVTQAQVIGVATQIPFGNTDNTLTSEADLTYDATGNVLSVGTMAVDGTNQSITGGAVDTDITIIPNGAGNVVIGNSGAGEIRADAGQSLTLGGDTLFLEGDTITLGSSTTPANLFGTFSGGSAVNHLVVSSSDTAVELDDFLGTIGLSFDSTTQKIKVLNQTAADYATGLTDNDLVNKKALDDALATATAPGTIATAVASAVDLSADNASLLTLPAVAVTILSVRVNVTVAGSGGVDLASTAGTIMPAADNDPSIAAIYMSDVYSVEAASSVVGLTSNGSTGTADIIVEYRIN